MKVLVACEFSGIVRDAFSARGHDAWSCDLLPSETEGNHIQGDVLELLDKGWDAMVGHPPCTFLSNSSVQHLSESSKAEIKGEARVAAMKEGAAFFNALKNAPIPKVAIENPIPHGYATALIGDYTQLIQPWMFGDGETKAVCLWLRGLPPLMRTHADNDLFCDPEPKERKARVHLMSPGPNRQKERSRFFPGIAKAMAEQWG